MKWFTSDLHFGHKNILEYCDRPCEDLYQMQEMLISNWNSVVKPIDDVFHLGDFSFLRPAETRAISASLNGNKHAIWGNHDSRNNLVSCGFTSVYHSAKLKLAKDVYVHLNHFPYYGDHEGLEDRYVELRPKRTDTNWLLHGHVHDCWQVKAEEKMINVGCDVWGFKPVSADKILDIIRKSR